MDKGIRITLIVLGIMITLLPTGVLVILSEEVVIGEQLCVDGNNNINLEGMMCEDTEYKVSGMPQKSSDTIMWVTGIFGLIIYAIGLFAKGEKDDA